MDAGRLTREMIDNALDEGRREREAFWWNQFQFVEVMAIMEREVTDRELWIEELAKKWGLVCGPTA